MSQVEPLYPGEFWTPRPLTRAYGEVLTQKLTVPKPPQAVVVKGVAQQLIRLVAMKAIYKLTAVAETRIFRWEVFTPGFNFLVQTFTATNSETTTLRLTIVSSTAPGTISSTNETVVVSVPDILLTEGYTAQITPVKPAAEDLWETPIALLESFPLTPGVHWPPRHHESHRG